MRDLELWQAATDVPEEKQGLKLRSYAKAAVDGLAVSEIKGTGGYKAVVNKLREAFEPYVETALRRAMEGALSGHHAPARRPWRSTSSALKGLKDVRRGAAYQGCGLPLAPAGEPGPGAGRQTDYLAGRRLL